MKNKIIINEVIPSVFPSFGTACWVGPENVRTWPAPQEGDDGVSLLTETLLEVSSKYKKVGFMMGFESVVRAPLRDVDRIRSNLSEAGVTTIDGSDIVRQLRVIKSPFEIERMRHGGLIASAAFAALPARLLAMQAESDEGTVSEREAQTAMTLLMKEFGADETPYVMTQSGMGGYDNIVLEPSDKHLQDGTVLVIDTGMRFESYFTDFDRNYIVGGDEYLTPEAARTHDKIWLATEAGFQMANKKSADGCKTATSHDIFNAQVNALGLDPATFSTGRLGHGLGLQYNFSFFTSPTLSFKN